MRFFLILGGLSVNHARGRDPPRLRRACRAGRCDQLSCATSGRVSSCAPSGRFQRKRQSVKTFGIGFGDIPQVSNVVRSVQTQCDEDVLVGVVGEVRIARCQQGRQERLVTDRGPVDPNAGPSLRAQGAEQRQRALPDVYWTIPAASHLVHGGRLCSPRPRGWPRYEGDWQAPQSRAVRTEMDGAVVRLKSASRPVGQDLPDAGPGGAAALGATPTRR